MTAKKRILFFDSGMGGLSNLQAVEQVYGERLEYFYLFDNELFPYSEKPDSLLINKLIPIISRAVATYGIEVVVIACNTASTLILEQLRQTISIPVIGVIPAIKPAVEYLISLQQTDKTVGILATKATVARPYLLRLIEQIAKPINYNVSLLGTTDLVEYVEAQIRQKATDKELTKILRPWLDNKDLNLGAIVLSCTHFSLIKDQIQQLFPEMPLIDACQAIARRVGYVLGFLTQAELHSQRAEFTAFCQVEQDTYGSHLVSSKHLLSTKLLDNTDIEIINDKFGFKDYTYFPHHNYHYI